MATISPAMQNVVDQAVGQIVGRLFGTKHREDRVAAARLETIWILKLQRLLAGDTMAPADDVAILIEAGLEMVTRHRPKTTVVNIILASPKHLDGRPCGL
jgi:hypothetical protein